jgi:MtrB/PioB family decaheme-associated outer membrane protein
VRIFHGTIRKMRNKFFSSLPKVSAIALVITAGSVITLSPAYSQEADTSAWGCEFCPFASGYRADYELGVSGVSDDSAYLGDETGYSKDGIYANLDGEGAYAGDGNQLRWTAEDLGLDSRFAEFSGGHQGTYDLSLAYREMPRTLFFTTDSIFLQSAGDTLSLPANWVRAPVTSGFTTLNTDLVRRDIESKRKILEVGGKYLPTSRFRFSANYRRQEHDGVDVYGGSYFTQASLLAASFDYVTDEVDLNLRYAADNGYLSLAWYFSDFDNSNDALNWENPFTSAPGAEFAALAQPPDNSFQQVSLSGSYRFAQYRTVAAFSTAFGRMEQNELFLPYTTNPTLIVGPLPRSRLDGKVDTTNLAFSLSSKVSDKARAKLAYRYDKRDNKTAQDLWTRVIADTFVSGQSEANIPYSFKRSTLNLSVDYDLSETVGISGGYDRKTIDRDFQEVAEQTEDSGWGRLRWRPSQTLRIDIRGGASERNIDRYNETLAATLGQNPLMRKYNLAYRYRSFGELTVTASPADSPLDLAFSGMYAEDDYSQSQLGITSGEDLRLTTDLSWALSDNASLFLTGGYEKIKSKQFGSELFATSDWRATNDDEFYTVGGGFRIRQIGGKYDLQMNYLRSDGTSEIKLNSASAGPSQFPDLESTFDYLRLMLSYRRSDRLEYTMNVRYQRFKAEDWALEGVGPATIPVVLTLGADPYDDDVFIFGLGFRYRVGGAGYSSTK